MDYLRQYDILNPNELIYPITIFGAGGIGSPTAFILKKMGALRVTVYDFDKVESHNIPNQAFYKEGDVGELKIDALSKNILEFTGTSIKTVNEKITENSLGIHNLEGIVIAALDTPEARRIVWNAVKINSKICLYIDGRIGGEVLQVFTIRPGQISDIEIYERNLKSKDEAAELPCSAQTIIYTPFITAGIIASKIKRWIKGEKYSRKLTFLLNSGTYLTQYEK